MTKIVEAAISEDGFDLQDIEIASQNSRSDGSLGIDLVLTLDYSHVSADSQKLQLTLNYFDEAFRKIETTAAETLQLKDIKALHLSSLSFEERKIYSQFQNLSHRFMEVLRDFSAFYSF